MELHSCCSVRAGGRAWPCIRTSTAKGDPQEGEEGAGSDGEKEARIGDTMNLRNGESVLGS